jgi:hypothetical protein
MAGGDGRAGDRGGGASNLAGDAAGFRYDAPATPYRFSADRAGRERRLGRDQQGAGCVYMRRHSPYTRWTKAMPGT